MRNSFARANIITSTSNTRFAVHLQHPQYVYPQRIQLWLLIFTITFMLSVTRMLSVKRGGVIILTAKNRELPPLIRLRLIFQKGTHKTRNSFP